MSISDSCGDATIRDGMHCAMTMGQTGQSTQAVSTASPEIQCEEMQSRGNTVLFLVGVIINVYNCWIVHSYETTVREGGGMSTPGSQGLADPLGSVAPS